MVMDRVADEVRKENQWTMMFADDTVICSETFRQVGRYDLGRRGMKMKKLNITEQLRV